MEPEPQGVESARELLVGQEVSAACFVRDYLELHVDGPIVRAISNPLGLWGCSPWQFPEDQSVTRLRSYIGQVVDGFVFVPDAYAQLSFGEHSFTVPLLQSHVDLVTEGKLVEFRFGRASTSKG